MSRFKIKTCIRVGRKLYRSVALALVLHHQACNNKLTFFCASDSPFLLSFIRAKANLSTSLSTGYEPGVSLLCHTPPVRSTLPTLSSKFVVFRNPCVFAELPKIHKSPNFSVQRFNGTFKHNAYITGNLPSIQTVEKPAFLQPSQLRRRRLQTGKT